VLSYAEPSKGAGRNTIVVRGQPPTCRRSKPRARRREAPNLWAVEYLILGGRLTT